MPVTINTFPNSKLGGASSDHLKLLGQEIEYVFSIIKVYVLLTLEGPASKLKVYRLQLPPPVFM